MPRIASSGLLVACVMLPAGCAVAQEWVSDGPWQSGYIYSVYDPHYGRLSPEVARDTNASGKPLAVRGVGFDKGFGCRGFSIIEMDVPPGAEGISGIVGIDDEEATASGDTYFSVWGEGRERWRSPALSREDPALAFTVPVAGLERIKLITDAQGYGNRDLADWCEVRWVREPTEAAAWRFLPQPGAWHVRAETRPFHLVYPGQDIAVTVIAGAPAAATVSWELRDDDDEVRRRGGAEVELAASPAGEAVAVAPVSLEGVTFGLYRLSVTVTAGGEEVVGRVIRFGLIDSHLGRSTEGSIYGVNHHEFISSYEPLAAAGVEWSRLWFCRQWIEPDRGQWSWNWHDERMAAARQFGLKTIGVLGGIGGPAWTSPGNAPEGYLTTHGFPADLDAWEEYVRQVATRYRGQIRVWESWNEIMGAAQNERWGWSVANYVELHKRTWRVLKEVDPENRVLLSADGLRFVQQCLDAGLGADFDGIVPHPYRPGHSPEAGCGNYSVGNVGDVLSVFPAARAWLAERGRPDAEVWATEIGWALSGRGWPTVSEEIHGQYLPRTFLLAQGSGEAANVCWHDFAHGMFGICNGQGYPRPAILSFAGLVSRLRDAVPVRRLELEGRLHGFVFRRGDGDVPALWAESGIEFAHLRPPRDLRVTLFDWFGNARTLDLPAAGRALPVTGRIAYLEGEGLEQVVVERREPLRLEPRVAQVVAGHAVTVNCSVENAFGEGDRFGVRAAPPEALSASEPEQEVRVPRGETRVAAVTLRAARGAGPAEHAVPVTVTLPDGLEAPLTAYVRVLAPLSVTVEPFDCALLGREPVAVSVLVRNHDDRALSGDVTIAVPEGFSAAPGEAAFGDLAPGATATVEVTITADRPPTAADSLLLQARATDGALAEARRSLQPTVSDADGDGVADGWRINPGGGPPERRNLAEVSIEPGHAEFLCQRIHCTRFGGGWIIFHRDGQDPIVKGRRYRITWWARQRDLEGTLGVAVYHINPWQSCGIESHFRVGADWQEFTTEFTATRDSDNARFEFYFTEEGTVWIEGMRLEEVPGPG